jgi:NNMT/PNMT/TEMT family protein
VFASMTVGPGADSEGQWPEGSLALQSSPSSTEEDADLSAERIPNGIQNAGPHRDGHHEHRRTNGEVEWDEFAPEAYWKHNYRYLRKDDRQIIRSVGQFFANHFGSKPPSGLTGIDVGSGANLYPALAMLPWCERIHLIDPSHANVTWLQKHIDGARNATSKSWEWKDFWAAYRKNKGGYLSVTNPRAKLAEVTDGRIRVRSVFDLPVNEYDIGTMFFVAESMTSFEREFDQATKNFLQSLRPGAPFAAAFMDSSMGYVVGDKSFPAVAEVTKDVVAKVLYDQFRADVKVEKVAVPAKDPLRDGYKGMIIAFGTTEVR